MMTSSRVSMEVGSCRVARVTIFRTLVFAGSYPIHFFFNFAIIHRRGR